MMLKVIGKAVADNEKLEQLEFEECSGYLGDGWFEGWYADGYIVGPVIEADEEYIINEYWVKVDEDTIRLKEEA